MIEPFFGSLLIAGWTYMWLVWCFQAHVRHAIVISLPDRWRNGVTAKTIGIMTNKELSAYLTVSWEGPQLLAGVLTCRYCLSAHIAAVAAIMLMCSGTPVILSILAWATGAAIANHFYKD